jgi:hypothetical protein
MSVVDRELIPLINIYEIKCGLDPCNKLHREISLKIE